MKAFTLIQAWRKQACVDWVAHGFNYAPSFCTVCAEALIDSIEAAELKRIQLEAEHLPISEYKLSAVQLKPAQECLNDNGYELDIVRPGSMWAVVALNVIEVGVLAERHIVGIPYDPASVTEELLRPTTPEYIDYDRIG